MLHRRGRGEAAPFAGEGAKRLCIMVMALADLVYRFAIRCTTPVLEGRIQFVLAWRWHRRRRRWL